MYEVKQNKKPISRTFSRLKKKTIQQLKNICNQNIYITQLCKKSSRPRKPVNRTEPICKARRVDTFYGLLKDLKGRQGPHVVAFVAIHSMLESFDFFQLNDYFYNKVFHPDGFADSIFSEILQDEKNLQNSSEWGNLKDIHNQYCAIYDECEKMLDSTLNLAGQEDTINSRKQEEYRENVILIRNMIEELVNMNLYATYAWHKAEGATAEELSGGEERSVNLAELKTAKDVISSRCLDVLFANSKTFTDYPMFCQYLQSVLPNLIEFEIHKLILSLPYVDIFLKQLNYNEQFIDYFAYDSIHRFPRNLQLKFLTELSLTSTNTITTLSRFDINDLVDILMFFCDTHKDEVFAIISKIIHCYNCCGKEQEKDIFCSLIGENSSELYYELLDHGIITEVAD